MTNLKLSSILFVITAVAFLAGAFSPALASGQKDMKGWGLDDDYNKLYKYRERDKLKGKVKKFKKIVPLDGMSPGTAFLLEEDEENITLVHLCPEWFATSREVGFRRGDIVKVKGAWAEIDGKDIFIAAKVKKDNDFEFKVRLTKDGKPFWTMSKEELAREKSTN